MGAEPPDPDATQPLGSISPPALKPGSIWVAPSRAADDATGDNPPLSDPELAVAPARGRRILKRYTLELELGRGGMGVVWKAFDEILAEIIALKLLPEFVASDAVAVDDLKQETRRARRLTHPNIVRTHDYFQDEEFAGVAMEFVDGATLTAFSQQQPGGICSVSTLAPLASQLCDALHYAHTSGQIVHRDLKPANLLVDANGVLKVADFGIARSLRDTRTRVTMHGAGCVRGTLRYMSPQQLMGDKPQAADDIYSLGATLYELLTGRPPFFRGDFLELLQQVRDQPPLPLDEQRKALGTAGEPIPIAWEETILACLAKEPGGRPQSAREVSVRLGLSKPAAGRRGIAHASIAETGTGSGSQRESWWNRRRIAVLGIASAVLVAGAATTTALFRTRRLTREPEAASPSSAVSTVSAPETVAEIPAGLPRECVVTVQPADAESRLWFGPWSDLKVVEGSAVLRDIPDGTHELVVQAQGYQPHTESVNVKDGRAAVAITLVALKGSLEISGRPGTRVLARDRRQKISEVGTIGSSATLSVSDVLPVGSYTLLFEHADCAPFEANNVAVGVGRVTRVSAQQPPLPATLSVVSATLGAEVRVNGRTIGTTPKATGQVGSEDALTVEVACAGYRTVQRKLTLAPREQRSLDVGALDRITGDILVQFANTRFPSIASRFSVDGNAVESRRTEAGSLIARQPIGTHVLTVLHPDYEPWSQSVEIADGRTTPLTAEPRPKPATIILEVKGPASYTAFVDGVKVPVSNDRLNIPPARPVALEIRAPGYRPIIGIITPDPNSEKTLPLVFQSQPRPTAGQPHENSLGMKFAPIPGAPVLCAIWETRVEDYDRFLHAIRGKRRPGNAEAKAGDPVVAVTWEEARKFCEWLTEFEREDGNLGPEQRYRLPTDLEWSTAVGLPRENGGSPAERNGKVLNQFPWGKEWPPPPNAGNYRGEEFGEFTNRVAGYKDAFKQLAPVGSFAPNRFGLFDLGGNVWEWCEDQFAASARPRVTRGGSFGDYERANLLSSVRVPRDPDGYYDNVGFRCVLDLGNPKTSERR